ncbi:MULTISPECIES: hypothetical protein [unclassified Microcoleus]
MGWVRELGVFQSWGAIAPQRGIAICYGLCEVNAWLKIHFKTTL